MAFMGYTDRSHTYKATTIKPFRPVPSMAERHHMHTQKAGWLGVAWVLGTIITGIVLLCAH